VGYGWRYVGFQIGAQVWSAWASEDEHHASIYALPQLELRGGPEHLAWAVVGFGSPLVTTYRRWGAYAGVGGKLGESTLLGTFGSFRSGPAGFDTSVGRFDLAWWWPLWSGYGPRLGASISNLGASEIDWEASLGMVGSL
jgi:hypothetical protein